MVLKIVVVINLSREKGLFLKNPMENFRKIYSKHKKSYCFLYKKLGNWVNKCQNKKKIDKAMFLAN